MAFCACFFAQLKNRRVCEFHVRASAFNARASVFKGAYVLCFIKSIFTGKLLTTFCKIVQKAKSNYGFSMNATLFRVLTTKHIAHPICARQPYSPDVARDLHYICPFRRKRVTTSHRSSRTSGE